MRPYNSTRANEQLSRRQSFFLPICTFAPPISPASCTYAIKAGRHRNVSACGIPVCCSPARRLSLRAFQNAVFSCSVFRITATPSRPLKLNLDENDFRKTVRQMQHFVPSTAIYLRIGAAPQQSNDSQPNAVKKKPHSPYKRGICKLPARVFPRNHLMQSIASVIQKV